MTKPVLSMPFYIPDPRLVRSLTTLINFHRRKNTSVNISYGRYRSLWTAVWIENFVWTLRCSLGHALCSRSRPMEYSCDHCHSYKNGDAYRVTCDEFGLQRLNMIVCYECYVDARRLGLCTNKMVKPRSPDTFRRWEWMPDLSDALTALRV